MDWDRSQLHRNKGHLHGLESHRRDHSGSVAEYKVVFTDSVHVLMSTAAQQSVPIAVATDQRSFQSCSSGVLTASRDMLYQLFGVGALAHRGLPPVRRFEREVPLAFPAPHHSAREGCPGHCGTLFYGTDFEQINDLSRVFARCSVPSIKAPQGSILGSGFWYVQTLCVFWEWPNLHFNASGGENGHSLMRACVGKPEASVSCHVV